MGAGGLNGLSEGIAGVFLGDPAGGSAGLGKGSPGCLSGTGLVSQGSDRIQTRFTWSMTFMNEYLGSGATF